MSANAATPASEWGGGRMVDLPSGRTVEVADPPPNIVALAIEGVLPMEVIEAVADGDEAALLALLFPAMDRLVGAVLLTPQVAAPGPDGKPPEGCILFRYLSNQDTELLVRLVLEQTTEVAADAATFRGESSGTASDAGSTHVGHDTVAPAAPA